MDNGNGFFDKFWLLVQDMGKDKWVILGQEMKKVWIYSPERTSSPLWEIDLIACGKVLVWDLSCGYFGTSTDWATQVPWHSLAGEDFWYVDVSLKVLDHWSLKQLNLTRLWKRGVFSSSLNFQQPLSNWQRASESKVIPWGRGLVLDHWFWWQSRHTNLKSFCHRPWPQ